MAACYRGRQAVKRPFALTEDYMLLFGRRCMCCGGRRQSAVVGCGCRWLGSEVDPRPCLGLFVYLFVVLPTFENLSEVCILYTGDDVVSIPTYGCDSSVSSTRKIIRGKRTGFKPAWLVQVHLPLPRSFQVSTSNGG